MSKTNPKYPLMTADDGGIRPAGPQDRCFYCEAAVGERHGSECVTIVKKVKMIYAFEIEITMPHHWTAKQIEAHRNESSWCADNAIRELERFAEAKGCLCGRFKAKFVEVVDPKPRKEND